MQRLIVWLIRFFKWLMPFFESMTPNRTAEKQILEALGNARNKQMMLLTHLFDPKIKPLQRKHALVVLGTIINRTEDYAAFIDLGEKIIDGDKSKESVDRLISFLPVTKEEQQNRCPTIA